MVTKRSIKGFWGRKSKIYKRIEDNQIQKNAALPTGSGAE